MDIATNYNRTAAWTANNIAPAAGRNIAALRDWVIAQGGPSHNSLQRLDIWLASYPGPGTPYSDPGGN